MKLDIQRKRILELVAHRDPPTDLKKASLACGKNHAYLHQFINRGTPRKLPEDVRYALARHLGVDESVLRAEQDPVAAVPRPGRSPVLPAADRSGGAGVIAVPEVRIAASAGGGAHLEQELDGIDWYFDAGWLRYELRATPRDLRIISIDGDSMEPVLCSGDKVMIDLSRTAPSPPGIFVLHDGIGLIAKQIELVPNSEPARLLIRSESPRYENYERTLDEVNIVGRVIWFARRL
ncbi:peptidase S24 [Nisaea acidiphila]|uniref:Peptidase S24 n=1 Tax=Nisaea acidiphila TaxID=1862145 RepID=A0A9J7AWX6_9PROT|nr:S24 family peptidase [Nisaea acidiphila]UUX51792.1 peptidase S24 [Nisaea acidiphila]